MTDQDIRARIARWKERVTPLELAETVDKPLRRGQTHMIRCPFHDDRDPSMAVYDDGFHCHGCGWHGDSVDFIMAVNNWSFRQFIDFVAGFQADPHMPRHAAADRPPRERPTLDPALITRWQDGIGERERGYWRERGIPLNTLLEFRVGWTGKRYAIPWYYRGALTAVKMRRDDDATPDLEPKYISLKGSRYAAPYNIDAVILARAVPDPLLIVEDEKSVWAASRHDMTAIASPANSWKADWAELICHVPNVVIVADWDDVGLQSAEAVQAIVRRANIVQAAGYFPDGREAKDLHDVHMALRGMDGFSMREFLGVGV